VVGKVFESVGDEDRTIGRFLFLKEPQGRNYNVSISRIWWKR
jgi:hypothetical protein